MTILGPIKLVVYKLILKTLSLVNAHKLLNLVMQNTRFLYAIAGSSFAAGIFNYFQNEKKVVQTSYNPNFTPSVKWDYNWDKRDVSSLVKPVKKNSKVQTDDEKAMEDQKRQKLIPTATRYLFFVRHGQYELNGKTDAERILTVLGRKQAEITGTRLKSLKFKFDKIIQSTMSRAQETAAIISKEFPDIPMESCEMLCEGSPIPSEPPIGKWRAEYTYLEDGTRIEAAYRKYFHRADATQKQDSWELFICHANVIRYFVCRALQFPPEAWQRFSLYNCSITFMAIRPSGRVSVYMIGDCGHIPAHQLTVS